MGNEVSAEGGGGQEMGEEEEDGWTSREESEVSGGLWRLSHDMEDGDEVCVFTCAASSASQIQLCLSGAEHMKLLRHPSVVKFLSYDCVSSPLVMVTEPVLPVRGVMSDMCEEGMVTGWRDVAEGLSFLHNKAKLSHNSVCSECVFVCAKTSHWKIGGFECAARHTKITHTFIETVAAIRPPSTIPPEDKSPSADSVQSVPCHSRDVWGFAQFMLSVSEDTPLSSGVSDSMYRYIEQEMLNEDPTLRPTAREVMDQPWMRNDVSEVANFLSQLTVKTQREKDHFFSSLPAGLHSLPPRVVAEHLLPLLLTPLVMAEKIAHSSLWSHLLTPVSAAHPRRMTFDPTRICPLFEEELFTYHAVPILLNLMESHDYHVRMVLLEHLLHFAPLCPGDELVSSLLPEVLVGLHDVSDDMVRATLGALADLVGILGGETVMGTPRRPIFADSTPRPRENVPVDKKTVTPPLTPLEAPPTEALSQAPPTPRPSQEETRRQRAEMMREKREMQLRKKMAASSAKLGVASSDVGGEGAESDDLAMPTSHAQYSPSVSHDEEDRVNVEEGEEIEGEGEGEGEDNWEEFEEEQWDEGDWGREGGGDVKEGDGDGVQVGSWNLSGSLNSGPDHRKEEEKSHNTVETRGALRLGSGSRTSKKQERGGEVPATLSEQDRQRLEEQAAWSMEPDFFADMTPSVAKTTSGSTLGVESREPPTKLSSLQYQLQPTEEEGWGGWSDDF